MRSVDQKKGLMLDGTYDIWFWFLWYVKPATRLMLLFLINSVNSIPWYHMFQRLFIWLELYYKKKSNLRIILKSYMQIQPLLWYCFVIFKIILNTSSIECSLSYSEYCKVFYFEFIRPLKPCNLYYVSFFCTQILFIVLKVMYMHCTKTIINLHEHKHSLSPIGLLTFNFDKKVGFILSPN